MSKLVSFIMLELYLIFPFYFESSSIHPFSSTTVIFSLLPTFLQNLVGANIVFLVFLFHTNISFELDFPRNILDSSSLGPIIDSVNLLVLFVPPQACNPFFLGQCLQFSNLCLLSLDINLPAFIYRYSVEKIPLYDSAEDEIFLHTVSSSSSKIEIGSGDKDMMDADDKIDSTLINIDPLASVVANGLASTVCRKYPLPKKKLKQLNKGKAKNLNQREFNANYVVSLLEAKEAQQEILVYEVQNGALLIILI